MATQGEERKLELTSQCCPFVIVSAPKQLPYRTLELTSQVTPYITEKPPVKKIIISC